MLDFEEKQKGPQELSLQTDQIQIQSRMIISQRENDENWAWGFIGCIRDFKTILLAKRRYLEDGLYPP